MAYEDDRDLDLDRSLYEEDPAYEADTYFGERLDDASLKGSDMDPEEYEEDDVPAATEVGFGESIKHEDTPHPNMPETGTSDSDSVSSEKTPEKSEEDI
jgi:hypothetical protein